jgi:hypothetical protein
LEQQSPAPSMFLPLIQPQRKLLLQPLEQLRSLSQTLQMLPWKLQPPLQLMSL